MRYSLRQLEVFLATARHENISRAARDLAMSQSAASGSLKELEGQFGVKLFDRVGKRLQLNELGRQLRPQAETLLAQARAFEQALAGEDGMGRLHIGATMTIGNYLAVGMIADFRSRYPDADVALSVANTETIAEGVAGFELDMGMIEGEFQHPELETLHWRDDELVVFAAPDHPAAGAGELGDRDLLSLPWIVRERGSGTRQTFDRAMHGLLPSLDIAMELQHTEAIKRAVEAGLGVGCLSRISLADAFGRGSLVELRTSTRDFSRELFLITHRRKFHGVALQRWLQLCQESAA
ncbi:MAG: LysR family transcriptional regulator [Halieaceae bacterium]|jgi:DNA-binding transcriptional LysR family regulator|nr:LysR family transcriptional regulator [Halieaceae bacterium]